MLQDKVARICCYRAGGADELAHRHMIWMTIEPIWPECNDRIGAELSDQPHERGQSTPLLCRPADAGIRQSEQLHALDSKGGAAGAQLALANGWKTFGSRQCRRRNRSKFATRGA